MITCWDATQMVVEEASAKFAPEWKEDAEKKDILKDYCILIGHLAERGGSTHYNTEIDEAKKRIIISFDVQDLKTHGSAVLRDGERDLPLYDLIDRAIVFRICTDEETGHPKLIFIFPSIWEKA